MFKADGAIGGTAEKVGGPFAKDGFIGLVSPFFVSSFLAPPQILCACSCLLGEVSRGAVNGSRGREKAAEYYWVERLLDEFPNVV
jgi:hypothetical protein